MKLNEIKYLMDFFKDVKKFQTVANQLPGDLEALDLHRSLIIEEEMELITEVINIFKTGIQYSNGAISDMSIEQISNLVKEIMDTIYVIVGYLIIQKYDENTEVSTLKKLDRNLLKLIQDLTSILEPYLDVNVAWTRVSDNNLLKVKSVVKDPKTGKIVKPKNLPKVDFIDLLKDTNNNE